MTKEPKMKERTELAAAIVNRLSTEQIREMLVERISEDLKDPVTFEASKSEVN